MWESDLVKMWNTQRSSLQTFTLGKAWERNPQHLGLSWILAAVQLLYKIPGPCSLKDVHYGSFCLERGKGRACKDKWNFLRCDRSWKGCDSSRHRRNPIIRNAAETYTSRWWVNLNFIFICFVKALHLLVSQPLSLIHFVLKGQEEKLKLL